tara:strand:+ start:158 stop:628 length:471 start_codon:yes stop_codon:yes gene_type:complete
MEAAVHVASNLRPDDYREVFEGHGHFPLLHLPQAALSHNSVYFTAPDGRIAGLAGVEDGGKIWMLCTPVIHDHEFTFAREAKRFVDSREDKLLWNIVDKRNTAHLKLLKFLGFKFLRELEHGPNKITFIEFCRVRTNSHNERSLSRSRLHGTKRSR